MPWTVSDVDKHKKGLSSEEKKKWVAIANKILKDCIAKGGTDATCAPKAIRIANSKFSEVIMKKESMNLNKKAMCFSEGQIVHFSKEDENPKLLMEAYSGSIIKNHWYWGDLAIDVSGMDIPEKPIPILHDHNTSEKIGFGSFKKTEKHKIEADETSFVDTPIAKEFIRLSKQGFPYQASISAKPTQILKLNEDEEAEVNGFVMKGPGTIWRKSVLRECSICTFGADGNTKSVAMSEKDEENMEVEVEEKLNFKEEKEVMKLDELKEKHPELYAQVIDLGKVVGKEEAEASFSAVKKTLDDKIKVLEGEKTDLSASLTSMETRVVKMEKALDIQKEKGIEASADAVFAKVMTAHSIPERLHSKIRKQISHQSFVADDKLDETKFVEAIETELKDWVPAEGEFSVLGISSLKTETSFKEEDKMVERMLGHVGQKAEATKH